MSDAYWEALGYSGQAIFFGRWIVQWIASERAGRVYIPMTYWWASVVGAVMVLAYAIHIASNVFICGMTVGLVIYVRNLTLARRERARAASADPPEDAP